MYMYVAVAIVHVHVANMHLGIEPIEVDTCTRT